MLENELVGLAVLFLFVIIGSIIATRFKQPVGIGLLLVGALIGPYAFNLLKDEKIIDGMVEIGSILLLFIIGLEFVIPKLVKIGFKALMIGVLKIGIVFFIGYEILLMTGMGQTEALIFGLLLSISSTVVIVKILESKGLYKREEMPLLIGILLIEDIFAVIMLTLMTQLSKGGGMVATLQNIAIAIIILGFAYFVMLKVSKFIISWFINNSGEEVITFIALGLCVGFSYLAYFLGLSPATGAFLAGSIVASLAEVKLFEHAIKPYSNLFTCLFFVSIGTKVNFTSLQENWILLSILLAVIIVSRFLAVGAISYLFANFRKDQPIFSSIAMIAVSEFSLLLAQAASVINPTVDFVSITASIIFVTAIIMSFSIGHYTKVSDILDNTAPREWANKPKSFSRYIKLLFDELDIENTNTKAFKKLLSSFMICLILGLFALIGWAKIAEIIHQSNMSIVLIYLIHALFAAFIIGTLLLGYRHGKRMKSTLVTILVTSDSSASPRKSRYILNNLIITFTLFTIAVFSPGLMTILHLPLWTNAIPFALLAVGIVRLRKMVTVIHHVSFRRPVFQDF